MLMAVAFAAVAAVVLSGSPVVRAPAQFDLADVGATVAPVAAPAAAPVVTTVPSTAVTTPVVVPTTTAPAPAPVPVPTVHATTAAATIEQRGAAALALVPFPVERTGYELIFEDHRDGYLGLTSTVDKTITIYIRSSQSTREIAKVIAHEVGHAVDVEFTTEAERLLYRQVRGIDGRSWYPDCSGCTDYDSPAGDFAETFAAAMVGDVSFLSTVADEPTALQLQALASIFTI